jgi:hypothetical protein
MDQLKLMAAFTVLLLAAIMWLVWRAVMSTRLDSSLSARARELVIQASMQVIALAGRPHAPEVARLLILLRCELKNTSDTLDAARLANWPMGNASELVFLLQRTAGELETHLRILSLERDTARAEVELKPRRLRVETVVSACGELRSALRNGALHEIDVQLQRLRTDCDIEAEALGTPPGTPRGQYDHSHEGDDKSASG